MREKIIVDESVLRGYEPGRTVLLLLSVVLLLAVGLLLRLSLERFRLVRVEIVPHAVEVSSVHVTWSSESSHVLLAGEAVRAILQWDNAVRLTQLSDAEARLMGRVVLLPRSASDSGHLEFWDVGRLVARLTLLTLALLRGRGTVVGLAGALLWAARLHAGLDRLLLGSTELLLGRLLGPGHFVISCEKLKRTEPSRN